MSKAGRPPINETMRQRIVADYKSGATQQAISDRYGMHRVTVNKILRDEGVPARPRRPKEPKKKIGRPKSKAFLLHLKIPRELKEQIDKCPHTPNKLVTALLKHYFHRIAKAE